MRNGAQKKKEKRKNRNQEKSRAAEGGSREGEGGKALPKVSYKGRLHRNRCLFCGCNNRKGRAKSKYKNYYQKLNRNQNAKGYEGLKCLSDQNPGI